MSYPKLWTCNIILKFAHDHSVMWPQTNHPLSIQSQPITVKALSRPSLWIYLHFIINKSVPASLVLHHMLYYHATRKIFKSSICLHCSFVCLTWLYHYLLLSGIDKLITGLQEVSLLLDSLCLPLVHLDFLYPMKPNVSYHQVVKLVPGREGE